jgi:hypothetical protein
LWVTDTGTTTFCEVKLSEPDFGKATDDDRHRNKLAKIYRPGLERHVNATLLEEGAFFEAYQVLRNVWHMLRVEHSYLLFLLPRANSLTSDTGGYWRRHSVSHHDCLSGRCSVTACHG